MNEAANLSFWNLEVSSGILAVRMRGVFWLLSDDDESAISIPVAGRRD